MMESAVQSSSYTSSYETYRPFVGLAPRQDKKGFGA
jgi:hypothetical protein